MLAIAGAMALLLGVVGVACGLIIAIDTTRLMKSLPLNPLNTATFAAVALGLVLAASLASYIPALRAD